MRDREIRLGVLTFLNAHPVYAGLGALASPADPVRFLAGEGVGDPVALTRALEAGDLDLAPASSVRVAGQPARFVSAPGISISSEGRVGSILLVSRVPPWELGGRTVALPPNSATSVALLRVLCREHWVVRPRFVPWTGTPRLSAMLAGHDAALLIGDEALRAGVEGPGLVRTDLGQTWYEFCRLPMVFALWAFRATWASARPEAFRWACGRLLQARAAGMEALPREIPRLAAERGLPEGLVREYYELLDFRFQESHRRGLELFLALAGALGEEDGAAFPAGPRAGAARREAAGGGL